MGNNLKNTALEIWKLANSRDPDDPVFVAAVAAHMGDAPTWKSLNLYNPDEEELVQVLCRVLPNIERDFPRSSDFPISSGDHAVGDLFVSSGFRDNDGHWYVAGWDMTQYCFTDARLFEVLAWQSMVYTGQNAAQEKGGA